MQGLLLWNIFSVIPDVKRPSAESWLGGDNHTGRLHMWDEAAWISGFVASLALLFNRLVELAHWSVWCLAQPTNLGLGLVPDTLSHRPWGVETGRSRGAWSTYAACSGGGERAPQTLWSNKAARSRKCCTHSNIALSRLCVSQRLKILCRIETGSHIMKTRLSKLFWKEILTKRTKKILLTDRKNLKRNFQLTSRNKKMLIRPLQNCSLR